MQWRGRCMMSGTVISASASVQLPAKGGMQSSKWTLPQGKWWPRQEIVEESVRWKMVKDSEVRQQPKPPLRVHPCGSLRIILWLAFTLLMRVWSYIHHQPNTREAGGLHPTEITDLSMLKYNCDWWIHESQPLIPQRRIFGWTPG